MKRAVLGVVTVAAMLSFSALLMPVAAHADMRSATTPAPSDSQLASYPSVAALAAAFASASTGPVISLTADLTGTKSDPAVSVRAGGSTTLDLHGHTLRLVAPNATAPALGVPDGTSLTIEDTVGGGSLIVNADSAGAGIGGPASVPNNSHDPAYGTIVISGATVTATSTDGAGIGSGYEGGDGGGSVTIGDKSTVTAVSNAAAGIGGAYYSGGSGPITIDGSSTVIATGGHFAVGGAGIGSGPNGFADAISIGGGSSVTATGGAGGAGIGAGSGAFATSVTISGSTVTATGLGNAAGIGGGEDGQGGTVTIDGGSVTAIGGGGAGIGAGAGNGGYNAGTLTIQQGSEVTASAVSGIAFGAAPGAQGPGTVVNDGTLTIPTGNGITIPTGSVMTNGGTIVLNGSITNQGTILNTGTIQNPENVVGHNTTVDLNGNGGAAIPVQAVSVYAATFSAGQITFPTATRAGYTFAGWYTAASGGTQVVATTDLGVDGPKSLTLFARWSANPYTVSFNSEGGSNVGAETVNNGDPATLPSPPVRAGHTFIGWYSAASGGAKWKFTTPITANTTLYAQWSLSQQVGAPDGNGDASAGGSSGNAPAGLTPSNLSTGAALADTGSKVGGWPMVGLALLLVAAGGALVSGRRRSRLVGEQDRSEGL